MKPANGTVAIAGAQTFRLGRKALRKGAASTIKIYPVGLNDVLRRTGGPQPPYSVIDYGDKNIPKALARGLIFIDFLPSNSRRSLA